MSELARWVDRKIETSRAREIDRSAPPSALATNQPQVCYIPAVCSKTRRAILFHCLYNPTRGLFVCDQMLDAEVMTNSATAARVYASREVDWACPVGIPCPCCRLRVKGFPQYPRAGSSFSCNCGKLNCFGSYRVVRGQLYVTCGACGELLRRRGRACRQLGGRS